MSNWVDLLDEMKEIKEFPNKRKSTSYVYFCYDCGYSSYLEKEYLNHLFFTHNYILKDKKIINK
jgi:hypothetical protein